MAHTARGAWQGGSIMARYTTVEALLEAVEEKADEERERVSAQMISIVAKELQAGTASLADWSTGIRQELTAIRQATERFPLFFSFSIDRGETPILIRVDMTKDKPELRFEEDFVHRGAEGYAAELVGSAELKISELGLDATAHLRFLAWRRAASTGAPKDLATVPMVCGGKTRHVSASNSVGAGFWLFLSSLQPNVGIHDCKALSQIVSQATGP